MPSTVVSAYSASMPCIFCDIVSGHAPCLPVAQSDLALAFLDINPATRGHTLVIPKRHARDLLHIAPTDLAACTQLARDVAQMAVHRLGADGVNTVNACGAAAWQSVFHFHWHVVPRYAGRDNMSLPWIPTPGDPAELAKTAVLLAGE